MLDTQWVAKSGFIEVCDVYAFLFHVTERRFFGVPPYLFWDFLNIFTEKDTEGLYEGKNQFVCVDHAGL